MFVSAGAGTGKTSVLVERYVRAVCERGLDVESILVITYTRKAAGELRSRIRAALVERGRPRPRARARRRLDLDDPRLLQPPAEGASVRRRARPALPRARRRRRGGAARRGVRARARGVLRGRRARAAAAARDVPRGRAAADAHGRLRDAALGGPRARARARRAPEPRRGDRRASARRPRCLAGDASRDATRSARNAAEALRGSRRRARRPSASSTSRRSSAAARAPRRTSRRARRVERAALEELAAHDRDLLQELLERFAAEYAAAKRRESAVDFEDLQLAARDLLRDDDEVRDADAAALPARDGRRVPGHEPAPVRAHRPRRASRGDRGLHGRRRVPVDLRLPARRRRGLPRAARGRRRTCSRCGATTARGRRCSRPSTTSSRARSATSSSRSPRPAEFADPVFGHPVELLVTDKASYRGHGRALAPRRGARDRARACASSSTRARRVPGEIVVLFAAGTDAERYEEELRRARAADLPRDRARLLRPAAGRRPARVPPAAAQPLRRRRARDRARVAVRRRLERRARAAPPRTRRGGRSSRRSSGRCRRASRPRTSGSCARSASATSGSSALSARVGLERLCEQILAEHDYDLAVLARWDGSRRFANLRKLGRLARQYEAIRGARSRRLRPLRARAGRARREGARGGRRGGGRGRGPPAHDPRREGPRVQGRDRRGRGARHRRAARPGTRSSRSRTAASGSAWCTRRAATGEPVFDFEEVREAERAQERAERLRLYYVAMTRAIDRLDRLGRDRPRAREPTARRRSAGCSTGSRRGDDVAAAGRGAASSSSVGRRASSSASTATAPRIAAAAGGAAGRRGRASSRSSASCRSGAPPVGLELAALEPIAGAAAARRPPPLVQRARALRALLVPLLRRARAGLRPVAPRGAEDGDAEEPGGLAGNEIGDAVHRLLEDVPLDATRAAGPRRARRRPCARGTRPRARRSSTASPGSSTRTARRSSRAASPSSRARGPERPFAFEHDGVLLHGRLDVLWREGGRALVARLQVERARRRRAGARSSRPSTALQRLVYALACLRDGAEEVEVVYQFLERPGRRRSRRRSRASDTPALEAELSEAIARIRAGDFRPRPSELACADCPALDLVCAGPRLPSLGTA